MSLLFTRGGRCIFWCPLLLILLFLTILRCSDGISFKIRGHSTSNSEDDDDAEESTTNNNGMTVDAVMEQQPDGVGGVGMPEIHIVKSKSTVGSRRNEVVESFFGSPYYSNNNDNEEDGDAISTQSEELKTSIHEEAMSIHDFLIATRRTLHRHPELMYQEKETSTNVQSILKELDIQFTSGWAVNTHQSVIPGPGGYGIVADIGSGESPCVLLRADMDALPILEKTVGIENFKSIHDGTMHACGHDGT